MLKHNFIVAVLLVIVIGFFSCQNKDSKKEEGEKQAFTVEGMIKGSPKSKIKIDMIGGGTTLTIDSTQIDESGKFTLKGESKMTDIYILKHENGQFSYFLIEPGEEVNVTADASNFALSMKVSGSKGSELLADIYNKHYLVMMQMDSMSQIYKQNEKTAKANDILADLTKKSEVVFEKHRQYLRTFIKSNTNSIASILALYQPIGQGRFLSPERDWDMFSLTDSILYKEYPNSVHVQNFHADVQNIKTQMNGGGQEEQQSPGMPAIGSIAPDISLPSPSGESYSLHSLRGKVVLLDFWASWCRPCREENPNVKKAYDKYSKKGFEIFQVSLDKSKEAWIQGISKDNLYWKYHVSDLKYWESEPAKLYGVSSIPSNFLIYKDGKIIASNLRGPALMAKLAEVLK